MGGNKYRFWSVEILKPFKIILGFSIVCAIFFIFFYKTSFQKTTKTDLPKTTESKIINSPNQSEVIITEHELNSKLESQLTDVVKNPKLDIHSDSLVLTGSVEKIVSLPVDISIVPTITNNQVEVQITKAKLGPLNAPETLTKALENRISNQFSNYKVSGITLSEDQIIINTIGDQT